MPEIGTFGLMSGDGKRTVAEWPKLPRPSSTLPTQTCPHVRDEVRLWGVSGQAAESAGGPRLTQSGHASSQNHEPTIANNATQRQIATANVMPNSTFWSIIAAARVPRPASQVGLAVEADRSRPEPDLAIAMARYYSKRSKTGTAGNYGARNLAFIAVFGPAPRLVDQDALVAPSRSRCRCGPERSKWWARRSPGWRPQRRS